MAIHFLYSVGEGIGNNIWAIPVIHSMLHQDKFSAFIFTVRTHYPELWMFDKRIIPVRPLDTFPNTITYTYAAYTAFRLALYPEDISILNHIPAPINTVENFRLHHEIDINAKPIEDFFQISLQAKKFMCVAIKGYLPPKIAKSICLLNTGLMTEKWNKRKYPHWKELVCLLKRKGFTIVNISSTDEEMIPGCDIHFRTVLSEVHKSLLSCEVIVGTDCGLLYMADALGLPCLGLYGATAVEKCKLINARSKSITLTREQSRCEYQPCYGSNFMLLCTTSKEQCMNFPPELVLHEIMQLYHDEYRREAEEYCGDDCHRKENCAK